jgi:hypothetical protein
MDLTTPALLFPAISLLLLAYTSRFLALAGLTRSLHADFVASKERTAVQQLSSLRERLRIIQGMQLLGVVSFGLCTLSMFLLLVEQELLGRWVFGSSLLTLLASLLLSLKEVASSNQALNIQLRDMEHEGAQTVP